jgi:hypothetical protein
MNLEQLRQHPSFPFPNFKQNDLEFLLLEMFWTEFFKDCLNEPGQVQDWEPLFPAERDGVPILVVVNTKLNRAVRVHLRTNEDQKPLYPAGNPDAAGNCFLPFDLWLDKIYNPMGDKEYPGLVVSTDMSPSALDLACQALRQFCKGADPGESTQAWIDKYYETLQERGYYWR